MKRTFYDDFENMATIEEDMVLPYAGSKVREKAYILSLFSLYDNNKMYFLSMYESEAAALEALNNFSCGSFREKIEARKIDYLFVGWFGHGTVVADKRKKIGCDYQKIAYIRESGFIDWKVDKNNLDPEAVEKIESLAVVIKDDFMKKWEKMPTFEKYTTIFDLLLGVDIKGLSVETAIDKYFDEYIRKC